MQIKVFEQAVAICIIRDWNQRAEFIRLTLWLNGFDVSLEKAKQKWLQRFDASKQSLQNKKDDLSDIEDFFGPISLKTARSIKIAPPTLDTQHLAATIATVMRTYYDPLYLPDRDDVREVSEILCEIGRVKTDIPGLAVDWGQKLINTLRHGISHLTIRRLIADASSDDLRNAQATWMQITQTCALFAKEHIDKQYLTRALSLRFVAAFAMVGIPAMLFAARLGFKHRIDQSIQIISAHISSPGDCDEPFCKIWKGFDPHEAIEQLIRMELMENQS